MLDVMIAEKINKAREYARMKHRDHYRRDGFTPYFIHLEAVANMLEWEDKIVWYLHDVIEDWFATYEELTNMFGNKIADRVQNLTHIKWEDYIDYIESVWQSNVPVKIADIVHNLSDKPTEKQIKKYYDALMTYSWANPYFENVLDDFVKKIKFK